MVVFKPKIHNNYLIFTVVLKDKEEEDVVDKVAEVVAEHHFFADWKGVANIRKSNVSQSPALPLSPLSVRIINQSEGRRPEARR